MTSHCVVAVADDPDPHPAAAVRWVMSPVWPLLRASPHPHQTHRQLAAQPRVKAKVIAAVWGTELIQFRAALAILHQDELKYLHQDDMKNRMNCTRTHHPGAK